MKRKTIIIISILILILFSFSFYFYRGFKVRRYYLSKYSKEYIAECKYYCGCTMNLGICTDECKEVLDKLKIKYKPVKRICDD